MWLETSDLLSFNLVKFCARWTTKQNMRHSLSMSNFLSSIKNTWPKNKSGIYCGILSGLMIGTSFVPFPPWAVLFCYVPLLYWCFSEKRNLKEVFVAGFLTQMVLTLIGFHWISHVTHEFGEFSWFLSFLTLLLFALVMHLYIAFALTLTVWISERRSLSIGKSLVLWALIIYLFEVYFPVLFPWHLGYGFLWSKIPIYQTSEWIGFEGLSLLIFAANAFLTWLWMRKSQGRKYLLALVLFCSFWIGLNILGMQLKKPWDQTDATAKLLLVQANIGNSDKIAAEKGGLFRTEILQRFLKLTAQNNLQDPALIVWPETAIPVVVDELSMWSRYQNLFSEWGQKNQVSNQSLFLSGAYSQEQKKLFNAFLVLNSQGRPILPAYRKTYLLAFGEYFPGSEMFPKLLEWFPFIANFGRGLGPMVLKTPAPFDLNIGAQICYEGLFPDFSRELAKLGAEVFVNVTNDSWFGDIAEPYQHMIMTLGRAVENRRPLIRSTNTGVSTVILANGDLQTMSPLFQEWSGLYELKYKKDPPKTFYTRFGDGLRYFAILLAIACVFL